MFTLSLSGLLCFLQSTVFLVGYITNSVVFPEPLSFEEEVDYIKKCEMGDEEARNVLIERNLRLVAHIAKKYSSTNVNKDDLISIGTIGLIKGINSYNSGKGVRLATYVAKCIDNLILTCWQQMCMFNVFFKRIF